MTAAEIFEHVKTRPGDPFDQEQAVRDFQALMGLGFFDRRTSRVVFVTGLRGGVEVFFVTHELPLIESVEFEGLGRGDEAALTEGLRRRRLEVSGGGVYDPDKARNSVTAMKELLRERGWRRVEVETLTHRTSTDTVKLTLVVRGLPPQKRLDGPKGPDAVARLTPSA